MRIFTVKDNGVGTFLPPFFAMSDDVAVAEIRQLVCATDKNVFSTYSEHFSLWELGTFDRETGQITGSEPVFMLNLSQLKDYENGPEIGDGS